LRTKFGDGGNRSPGPMRRQELNIGLLSATAAIDHQDPRLWANWLRPRQQRREGAAAATFEKCRRSARRTARRRLDQRGAIVGGHRSDDSCAGDGGCRGQGRTPRAR
ncbi:hypothetical protein Dimus_037789, partial [Dionaea muscipula]